MARRRLVDDWRQARRHGRLCRRLELEIPTAPAAEYPRPPEDAPESLVPVLVALAQLDEPDREVLILTYWDGLSGQEAARVMGLNPAAFRMRLGRARRRLVKETENQHGM